MKSTAERKIFAFFLLLSLLFVSLASLSACATQPKEYEHTWFDYFDSFATLKAYAETPEKFEEYSNLCHSMLEEYHRLLDVYHEYEGIQNLKTLNESSENVTVDPKLGEFLKFGKEMYRLTDGTTNIAMGSVLSLWHTARETKQLPTQEALLAANQHVNINDLSISDDNTTVQRNDPLLKIDAGALGKGFVAEKISQALKEHGCDSFLLNLGGNTLAHGTKPNGDEWLAGVENPTEGKGLAGSVKLSGYALVTSGSYQRYFTVGETKYHHIIHPETLFPENHCLSVSVLCPDSGMADALSTALFCMPPEDGMALLRNIPNTEAIWLFSDGSVKTTDGFMNHVKNGETK